jgi:HAD superfamily hydrolase (TIGR01509 family)
MSFGRIGLTDENPNLKAILFDLMGVLLFLRRDYSGEETVDAVDDMIGGVLDDAAFRRAVLERFSFDEAAFQGILARIPEKYEAYPPLWNLLPALRKRYSLGIINNGTRLTFPYFDAKFNISKQFHLALSSGAEGIRKPDLLIYRRASDRLGVEPRHCLFLDDTETHIRGARESGMQTVFWENREEGFQLFLARLRSDGMAV